MHYRHDWRPGMEKSPNQEVIEQGGAEPVGAHIPDAAGSTPAPASTSALIVSSRDLRAALDEAVLTTLLLLVEEDGGRYLFPLGGLPSLLFQSPPEGNA